MFHKTIEFSPTLVIGHMLLGHASIMLSRFDEAIAELQEAVRLSDGDSWMKGSLVYAYAAAGRRDQASSLLTELLEGAPASGYRRSYPIDLAYAGLGDKDRTFSRLEGLAAINWWEAAFQMQRPELALLRGDPRVAALRQRLRLPPLN